MSRENLNETTNVAEAEVSAPRHHRSHRFGVDAARRAFFGQAVAWSVVGLAGGLFYRTMSVHFDQRGGQLALVHTHALTLGVLFGLVCYALAERLTGRLGTSVLWVWNLGLAITVSSLLVNGYLTMAGSSVANTAAIAGISGLGHMTLTAGFVLLLMALRPSRVVADAAEPREVVTA